MSESEMEGGREGRKTQKQQKRQIVVDAAFDSITDNNITNQIPGMPIRYPAICGMKWIAW